MSAEPGKVEALVEECVAQLRTRGLRRTKGLDALLRHMAVRHRPATLADLQDVPGLAGHDQATIYRLVTKLEEAGLVRRLGLHGRAMFFQLVVADHHHDYLVCTACGKIEDLDLRCPVEALEKEIMKSRGYRSVYHELEFYGLCPACTRDD
ncbi:MAG: Fur family transcriptional regulator [Verrucomicrobiales bacterium]